MKNWLRRIRRLARGSAVSPGRATEFLRLGDAARSAGHWSEAADQYARHLAQQPRDFGIWVQHGHALKEAGRLADADRSYGRALSLNPKDVDLLVNYGHLKKMRLDYAAAARLYGAAADIDPGGPALIELGSALIAPHVSPEHHRLIDAVAGSALAERCRGLTLLNSAAVIPLGGDRFELTSSDPWLEFRLDGAGQGVIGELTLDVRSELEGRRLGGRLYLDYGTGYNHEHSIELPETRDGRSIVSLAGLGQIRSIRWDPDDKGNVIRFGGLVFEAKADINATLARVRAVYPAEVELDEDFKAVRKTLEAGGLTPERAISISRFLGSSGADSPFDYPFWLRRWVNPGPADYVRMEAMAAAFQRRPTFSFVMPVYNPPVALLGECIDSLLAQTWTDFEICIADDNSPNPEIRRLLEQYAARDHRIKLVLRPENGHISSCSNSALALASGEFIVLVDHDDLVPDYCLFVVAHYINLNPSAQVLYSDEDKITVDGQRYDPYFKSDFDPFLMFGHNMISHLGVYSRELLEAIGGFRIGLEGSQDYDLALRAIERVGVGCVVHIPHILYHWRAIPGSTAVSSDEKSYAVIAAQQAVNGHFERRGLPLRSVPGLGPGVNSVKPDRDYDTFVSIIIPTRDGVEYIRPCIESILSRPHSNVEILVVDNGSKDPATLSYLSQIQSDSPETIRLLNYPGEFNFSEINNFAFSHARGDIICLLNNDTEVISDDWLSRARGLIAVPGVGVVGARLLYPDKTVQHFGVVTGMARHRVAGTPHVGLPEDAGGYFGKARLLQQFSAVTAACLFIRADIFTAVGGLEPDLRVAYNDIDLCLKVRAAGHMVIADPEIVLTHKESKSRGSDRSGAKAERLDHEAAIMRTRWGALLDRDPFWSANHDLDHIDFRLSQPPRQPMPWCRPDDPRFTQSSRHHFDPNRSYLSNVWAARTSLHGKAVGQAREASGLGVVIQAGAASLKQTIETLESLGSQRLAPQWIAVVIDSTISRIKFEDLTDSPELRGVFAAYGDSFTEGLRAALAVGHSEQVLLVSAGDILEPEAIERFSEAFSDSVDIAYSDAIATGSEIEDIQHLVAHPAFSYDGYLSRPYFGSGTATSRSVLECAINSEKTHVPENITDLVLHCLELANEVAHIPAFLIRTRNDGDDSEMTLLAVNRHLERVGLGAHASVGATTGTFKVDYPKPKGRTLIIIPTKDGVDLLRTCIESVRRTTADVDIVIIDHDSALPETLEYLTDLKGHVKIEPYSGPFNFSAMNNQAVARYGDDYEFLVFLNNDIEAIEPGWLERMKSLAARPDVGVVGATLLFDDRTIQHSGVILGVGGCADHGQRGADFERNGLRNPGYDASLVSTRDYSAVTAACMMMRTEVFRGVGGFDTDLAVGFNDTDLCLRVGSLGYRVLNDAHTVLYHHESATRSLTDDLKHPEDALYFMRRWKVLLAMGDPFYSPLLSLTTDYDLGEITDVYKPVRIVRTRPTLRPLSQGRPSGSPPPLRYHLG